MIDDENDINKLREVMSVISVEIPKLLDAISKTMYSPENAQKLGEQTAAFYKKLKESGMSEDQAFELTQDYMKNFSMGNMIENIIGSASHKNDFDDEIQDMIDKKIKKKMKEKLGVDDDD
jgi:hypothetical protein